MVEHCDEGAGWVGGGDKSTEVERILIHVDVGKSPICLFIYKRQVKDINY
jgi:hypothetical protein